MKWTLSSLSCSVTSWTTESKLGQKLMPGEVWETVMDHWPCWLGEDYRSIQVWAGNVTEFWTSILTFFNLGTENIKKEISVTNELTRTRRKTFLYPKTTMRKFSEPHPHYITLPPRSTYTVNSHFNCKLEVTPDNTGPPILLRGHFGPQSH